jgi:hypothetical protein
MMKKTKVNQGKDIYDEKRQRNTMQKVERKKKMMMIKECSTYKNDFDQK